MNFGALTKEYKLQSAIRVLGTADIYEAFVADVDKKEGEGEEESVLDSSSYIFFCFRCKRQRK